MTFRISLPDESAQSEGRVGWQHLAFLVNIANVELNRGVIVSLDETVRSSAFSRDVEVDKFSFVVLHIWRLQKISET